jgi:hypothetical protein
MASEGTPLQGLDYAASKVYTSALSLVCYTNAAGSLGDATTYASLTQPATANGYAPIALDGTWTYSNGTVTYLKSGANPRWTASGTWGATVYGMAMVDIVANKILHFRDNAVPFVASNLKKLDCDVTQMVS